MNEITKISSFRLRYFAVAPSLFRYGAFVISLWRLRYVAAKKRKNKMAQISYYSFVLLVTLPFQWCQNV